MVRNWPGEAAGAGSESSAVRVIEITSLLSGSIDCTRSARNPVQVGGAFLSGPPSRGAGSRSSSSWKGSLPPFAERWDAEGAGQVAAGAVREVQQRVDLRHRHALPSGGELDDLLPG